MRTFNRLILFAAFFASSVMAETPAADTPTPEPSPTRPSDLSSLRVELALSNMELFPSTENRIELISALEEDIGRKCFGNLFRTFYYDHQASSQPCLDVTEIALTKDPGNPTAICARYGFEAPVCREASLSQELVDEPTTIGSSKLELDIKLAMGRVDQEASAIEGEIFSLSSPFDTEESKEKKRGLLRKIVRLRCQFYRGTPREQHVTPTPTAVPGLVLHDIPFESPPTVAAGSGPPKNPLDDLIGVFATTPQPTPEMEAKRYRLVSSQCKKAIENLAGSYPEDPFVACYREGVYTPRCIEALRKERESVPPPSSLSSSAGTPGAAITPRNFQSGLEPF